jgi:predicted N-formylglutamate amidohydrolase
MHEAADWPAPVEILNENGASGIVLLCEHASNHVPADYAELGLPSEQLNRHIAWDIGAADVARRLSNLLDAPAFFGTYSRLLIDLNRPLER